MSGIAGIVLAEPAPILPLYIREEFQVLLSALAHRGSGEAFEWQGPGAAIGLHSRAWTSEDQNNRPVVANGASGCVLAWDGRLDNRDEMLEALGERDRALGDAELVLSAFLRWQHGCAARLVGDYAVTIWDPRTRTLHAARDPLGLRPLVYSADPTRIAFASELQALAQLPGLAAELDEETLCEFLLWWSDFPNTARTPYRRILRLEPGHWLEWNRGQVRLERTWRIDPRHRVAYAKTEDHADHFQALFSQAVRVRLRSTEPIGIFLSGGMDSAAVAGEAARLAGNSGKLHAYCGKRFDPRDESDRAEHAAQLAGIPFHCVPLRPASILDGLETQLQRLGHPLLDEGWVHEQALLDAAREDGVRVILTGDGSDELFNFPWAYVADLLRARRWLQLRRELPQLARYHGRSRLEMLWKSAPFLAPDGILAAWRWLRWRRPPHWINPAFTRRTRLLQRLRRVRPRAPFASISAEFDFWTLTRGRTAWVQESREILAAHRGVEFRFPFHDRRLIEYMLAVPWEEKVARGRVKSFLRQVPGLVPQKLSALEEKADYREFNEALLRQLDATRLCALFDSPPPRAAEFVQLPAAREICHAFLNGDLRQEATCWVLACFFRWMQGGAMQPSTSKRSHRVT